MNWTNEKKAVLETALKMSEKGLVIGISGNVSVRLPPANGRGLLAITPTSRYYDLLTPEDIQVIDFEAEPVEGDLPPSVESMLHIAVYQARPGVKAVIRTPFGFRLLPWRQPTSKYRPSWKTR